MNLMLQQLVFLLVFGLVQGLALDCGEPGLYPNPNDVTCSSYIKCGTSGEILPCPNATAFDPIIRRCTASYVCTHQALRCNKQGNQAHPNDKTCKLYLDCKRIWQTWVFKVSKCPENESFDPDLLQCSSKYVCPSSEICEKQGRFPSRYDTTCSKYYLCIQFQGEFLKMPFDCRTNSYFDPANKICSTNYDCVNGTLTPKINQGRFNFEEESNEINCTGMSFGPHPNIFDEDCREYFYCSKLADGNYKVTKYSCRTGYVYNPEKVMCSWSYVCPYKSTTTQASTTETLEEENTAKTQMESSTEYLEQSDGTTENILEDLSAEITTKTAPQSVVTTETVVGVTETLGLTTESSPQTVVTTENMIEVTESVTAEFTGNTQQPVISTQTIGSTETLSEYPTTESVEVNTDDPDITTNQPSVTTLMDEVTSVVRCRKRGYYKDSTEDTCKSFVFCDVLSDGSIYPYRMSCPEAYNFDPRSNLCSPSYQCRDQGVENDGDTKIVFQSL